MELQLRGERIRIERGRPLLMGILNVGLDSVADSHVFADTRSSVAYGLRLVEEGAQIVDVGAVSGRTDTPAISEVEEISLVAPVVAELTAAGIPVSADTWRPKVVEAVLEAGAALINDVSGLADTAVARLAAQSGAALVIMHTRAAPKEALFPGYDDPMGDVIAYLEGAIDEAQKLGVRAEQIIVDPGLDYSKTPEESIEVLRRLDELQVFERPVLLAVSRKYFIGMITGRPPEERLAGTLAAISFGVKKGANILRVHDVGEVADYLSLTRDLSATGAITLHGDPGDDGLRWIAPKQRPPRV